MRKKTIVFLMALLSLAFFSAPPAWADKVTGIQYAFAAPLAIGQEPPMPFMEAIVDEPPGDIHAYLDPKFQSGLPAPERNPFCGVAQPQDLKADRNEAPRADGYSVVFSSAVTSIDKASKAINTTGRTAALVEAELQLASMRQQIQALSQPVHTPNCHFPVASAEEGRVSES